MELAPSARCHCCSACTTELTLSAPCRRCVLGGACPQIVEEDGGERVTATPLGRIASYYYLDHWTVGEVSTRRQPCLSCCVLAPLL
jgi:hypothetical protein